MRGTVQSGCKAKKAHCPVCQKTTLGLFYDNVYTCSVCQGEVYPDQREKQQLKSLSYFMVPEDIREIIGKKPQTLNVIPAHRELHRVIPNSYAYYTKDGALYCAGDGVVSERYDPNSRQTVKHDGPCGDDCQHYQSRRCRASGVFYFYLPEVDMFGGYRIKMKEQSIINIISTLKKLSDTNGNISRVVCQLRITAKKRSDGTTYHVLDLVPPATNLRQLIASRGGSAHVDLFAITGGLVESCDGTNWKEKKSTVEEE